MEWGCMCVGDTYSRNFSDRFYLFPSIPTTTIGSPFMCSRKPSSSLAAWLFAIYSTSLGQNGCEQGGSYITGEGSWDVKQQQKNSIDCNVVLYLLIGACAYRT